MLPRPRRRSWRDRPQFCSGSTEGLLLRHRLKNIFNFNLRPSQSCRRAKFDFWTLQMTPRPACLLSPVRASSNVLTSLFKSITPSLSCLMSFNHPFCCVTIDPLRRVMHHNQTVKAKWRGGGSRDRRRWSFKKWATNTKYIILNWKGVKGQKEWEWQTMGDK